MKNTQTVFRIRIVFIAIAILLSYTWTVNVAHADSAAAQLSIAPSGQVIARDAKVRYVSGNTIFAVTTWGAMSITWAIETSGSTRFVPDAESNKAIQSIKAGDHIAFSGELDTSAEQPTVRATVVKDVSLQKDAMVQTGAVLSVDAGKHSFSMGSADVTMTVTIGTGTILTRDGNMASLSDLAVGETVKVFGSLNTVTDIISADKVTWKSDAQAVSGPPGGVFSGLISWLKGNRGIFSVL